MPDPPRISCILLAAGISRRLGRNKLLLEVEGEPSVRRAARALLGSKAAEVIAVTGHEREKIEDALAGLPVRFAHNERYAEGQAGSLQCGLQAADPGAAGYLFALGDQPLLSAGLVDRLIQAFGTEAPPPLIAAPFAEGKRGNPVLFSAELKSELAALTGDRGAREIIEKVRAEAPDRFRAVEAESADLFLDIDTEADYKRITGKEPENT